MPVSTRAGTFSAGLIHERQQQRELRSAWPFPPRRVFAHRDHHVHRSDLIGRIVALRGAGERFLDLTDGGEPGIVLPHLNTRSVDLSNSGPQVLVQPPVTERLSELVFGHPGRTPSGSIPVSEAGYEHKAVKTDHRCQSPGIGDSIAVAPENMKQSAIDCDVNKFTERAKLQRVRHLESCRIVA
jgi:hypothetical protein